MLQDQSPQKKTRGTEVFTPTSPRKAFFSQSLFDMLARRNPDAVIGMHLTRDGRIVAAMEYGEGESKLMHRPDITQPLSMMGGRVGDFNVEKLGLLGVTKVRDIQVQMQTQACDTVIELLEKYNQQMHSDPVSKVVERFGKDLSLHLL